MSKIKLVITDVDGTLVTTEKALRPSAVAAVRKLRDQGIGFTICSSRPPFGLRTMRDALQIELPFGGYNGGSILDRNGDHVDHEIHTIDVLPTVVGAYTDYHFSAVGKIVGASNNHDLIAKV